MGVIIHLLSTMDTPVVMMVPAGRTCWKVTKVLYPCTTKYGCARWGDGRNCLVTSGEAVGFWTSRKDWRGIVWYVLQFKTFTYSTHRHKIWSGSNTLIHDIWLSHDSKSDMWHVGQLHQHACGRWSFFACQTWDWKSTLLRLEKTWTISWMYNSRLCVKL